MTRAERRRMERESGSRTTYQFTLGQEIAKEIDEHIQEE